MVARAILPGALLIRYSTAKAVLDVGTTKFHELINDGVLDVVPIGLRGRRVTVESVERVANEGVPVTRRRKVTIDKDVEVMPAVMPAPPDDATGQVVPLRLHRPIERRTPQPRPIIKRPTS